MCKSKHTDNGLHKIPTNTCLLLHYVCCVCQLLRILSTLLIWQITTAHLLSMVGQSCQDFPIPARLRLYIILTRASIALEAKPEKPKYPCYSLVPEISSISKNQPFTVSFLQHTFPAWCDFNYWKTSRSWHKTRHYKNVNCWNFSMGAAIFDCAILCCTLLLSLLISPPRHLFHEIWATSKANSPPVTKFRVYAWLVAPLWAKGHCVSDKSRLRKKLKSG